MCDSCSAFKPHSAERELVEALVRDAASAPIDLAIVLGSGWSHIADSGQLIAEYNYSDWACFPADPVAGHAGRLRLIQHLDRRILCFAGRFHCYQGLSAFEASLPVRIASALACPRVLLTCAAGGIHPEFEPGDFMWLSDHINLLGDNPLKGLPGDVFVDLGHLYHQGCFEPLRAGMQGPGNVLHRGVLAAMAGPSYETPAEVRMLAGLGADVVSMSMVHEAIMARFLRMEVAGLALITNHAAGLAAGRLDHRDVLARGDSSRCQARQLVDQIVSLWKTNLPS